MQWIRFFHLRILELLELEHNASLKYKAYRRRVVPLQKVEWFRTMVLEVEDGERIHPNPGPSNAWSQMVVSSCKLYPHGDPPSRFRKKLPPLTKVRWHRVMALEFEDGERIHPNPGPAPVMGANETSPAHITADTNKLSIICTFAL